MNNYLPLIITGVSLNAIAQIFLKKGMLTLGYFEFNTYNIVSLPLKMLSNISLWMGIFCYLLSIGLWLLVLSRVEVSYAYPFLSIGYILTAFIAYFYLGENINVYRAFGILCICIGLFSISKS